MATADVPIALYGLYRCKVPLWDGQVTGHEACRTFIEETGWPVPRSFKYETDPQQRLVWNTYREVCWSRVNLFGEVFFNWFNKCLLTRPFRQEPADLRVSMVLKFPMVMFELADIFRALYPEDQSLQWLYRDSAEDLMIDQNPWQNKPEQEAKAHGSKVFTQLMAEGSTLEAPEFPTALGEVPDGQ